MIPIIIVGDIDLVPVIHPGAFKMFICDCKAHGANQVQPAPCGSTGPGNVSGILRNFRLHQHDIQRHQEFSIIRFTRETKCPG